MKTPDFKNVHLFDRLVWAKKNLKPYYTDYRIVYENTIDKCDSVVVPDQNWMACAIQGHILPPVWVYLELAKDEAHPDFKEHTRGYLLHTVEPIGPMTEEEAIEYLIMKDVPQNVWTNWNKGNKPKLVICKKQQLPATRDWRDAWKIKEDIAIDMVA